MRSPQEPARRRNTLGSRSISPRSPSAIRATRSDMPSSPLPTEAVSRIADAAVTHDRLAQLSRHAAKEAIAAAEMHEQLARLAQ